MDGQQPAPVSNDVVTRRIRTIVADDSPAFLRVLGAFLETQPELEIVGWGNHGGDVMALVEWLQPELVVLDMEMPVLSGLQAAAMLRAQSPALRIVIISINDSPTWREECRRAGVDVFVPKQSLIRELPAQIKLLFAHTGGSSGGK